MKPFFMPKQKMFLLFYLLTLLSGHCRLSVSKTLNPIYCFTKGKFYSDTILYNGVVSYAGIFNYASEKLATERLLK